MRAHLRCTCSGGRRAQSEPVARGMRRRTAVNFLARTRAGGPSARASPLTKLARDTGEPSRSHVDQHLGLGSTRFGPGAAQIWVGFDLTHSKVKGPIASISKHLTGPQQLAGKLVAGSCCAACCPNRSVSMLGRATRRLGRDLLLPATDPCSFEFSWSNPTHICVAPGPNLVEPKPRCWPAPKRLVPSISGGLTLCAANPR